MATIQKQTQTIRLEMEQLRKQCESNISSHLQEIDESASLLHQSLLSISSISQSNALNQAKLGQLKAELRELDDELVRALAVKTRKEAKRMAIGDSLSETKIKVDELQKIIRDQAGRKVEYAAILSEQAKALAESEAKSREAARNREEVEGACSWYNRVLGFRINGGHGVKFTFTCIDKKCPTKEYSITIRHANNVYTLIQCDPQLNDIEESVKELNKSNDLFKFVRITRQKFRAAALGSTSQYIYEDKDTTSVSISAPQSLASVDSRDQSPLPLQEINRDATKTGSRKGLKSHLLSPVSASSPRLVAMKKREV